MTRLGHRTNQRVKWVIIGGLIAIVLRVGTVVLEDYMVRNGDQFD